MEKDMKFTTAGEMEQDLTYLLSPHGRQKHTAEWVIERYESHESYMDNPAIQRWVAASQQILADSNSEERSSLYVEPGE